MLSLTNFKQFWNAYKKEIPILISNNSTITKSKEYYTPTLVTGNLKTLGKNDRVVILNVDQASSNFRLPNFYSTGDLVPEGRMVVFVNLNSNPITLEKTDGTDLVTNLAIYSTGGDLFSNATYLTFFNNNWEVKKKYNALNDQNIVEPVFHEYIKFKNINYDPEPNLLRPDEAFLYNKNGSLYFIPSVNDEEDGFVVERPADRSGIGENQLFYLTTNNTKYDLNGNRLIDRITDDEIAEVTTTNDYLTFGDGYLNTALQLASNEYITLSQPITMTVDMGFSFYFKVTNLTHGGTSDADNTPHFFYLEFSNSDNSYQGIINVYTDSGDDSLKVRIQNKATTPNKDFTNSSDYVGGVSSDYGSIVINKWYIFTFSIDNSGGTNAITVILRNVTDNITYDGATLLEPNIGDVSNWNGLTIDSFIIFKDMIGLIDEIKYFTDPITLTDINNGKI